MHQHYYFFPFGEDGTISPAIPNDTDPSGFVSYQQGWTFDYQRNLLTDPAAKSPTYTNFNAILNDITVNLQDYQRNGTPEYIDNADNGGSAFSYRIGAMVRYSAGGSAPFGLYLNTLDNNTNVPGGTGWVNLITAQTGRYLGTQVLSGAGTFTAVAGTGSVVFEGVGGGGGGGGVAACTTGQSAAAAGASAGSYASVRMTANFNGGAYSVGTDGTGSSNANGTNGGATTFNLSGNGFSIPGGIGSVASAPTTVASVAPAAVSPAGATVSGSAVVLNAASGNQGQYGLIAMPGASAGQAGGTGAAGPWGGSGNGTNTGNGGSSTGYGGGGGGGAAFDGVGPFAGGNGGIGTLLAHQFS